MYKVFLIAAAFVATEAVYEQNYHEPKDYYVEPHYSFAYEVHDSHTGDYKSHKEERKGDHTQGVYSLVEPDGSKRTVEYVVEGKSGFNAKVHREHSKHPQGYKSGGHQQSYTLPSHNSGYQQQSYHSQPIYQSHAQPSYQQSYSKPSYQQSYSQPSYQSYKPSYQQPSYSGHGHATSSVQISTHGAKIATSTYHAAPSKHVGY